MVFRKSRQRQTAILIDEPTLDALDQLAASEQVSRADVIRRLIRRGLDLERMMGGGGERREVRPTVEVAVGE